jgi:O-antigen/teichoic acid export membrane protein
VAQLWFAAILALARGLGLRVVWTAHNTLPHEPVFADDAAARRTLVRRSDLVVMHAAATERALSAIGAAPRRSVVVGFPAPSPVSTGDAARAPAAGDGPRHYLFFGKVLAYKGVEELLAAVAGLGPQDGVRVTVAGACPDPALRGRLVAAAAPLGDRVALRLEHVPDAEVGALLASADMVVLPFRAVTNSSSVLLALAHGRPVLLPDLPAFEELTEGVVRYDGTVAGLAATLAATSRWSAESVQRAGRAAHAHAGRRQWPEAAARVAEAMAAIEHAPRARRLSPAGLRRRIAAEPMYRGSLLLLANTVLLSAFGFAFWAVAARSYPAAAVGVFSGLTSTVTLMAAVGGLGLPNTVIRHLHGVERPRAFIAAAIAALVGLGGIVCLGVIVGLGPHLPGSLRLHGDAGRSALVVVLVVLAAASGATDGALVSLRALRPLLLSNLAGSLVKVALLVPLTGLSTTGLLLATAAGSLVASAMSGLAAWRRLPAASPLRGGLSLLRRYASFSVGNYAGTVFGILPMTAVPLLVLAQRGPREAAWFAVAFLVAGFLNFIPSTAAQVLFAEASRDGGPLRPHVAKALRAVFGLLVPALAVLLVAAPLVLDLFGSAYSHGAASALRVLGLGALFTGGTYLVDAVLAARDRVGGYVLMNVANAGLVMAAVAVGLPHGLTAGAAGWAVAQALSLALGLVVLVVLRSVPRREPARRAALA